MDNFKKENQTEIVAEENKLVLEDEAATKLSTGVPDLNAESLALIEQIVASTDENQTKDLTHLFNLNQTKKTLARVNKLSELMDTITDQALARFTQKPDEISNKEMLEKITEKQASVHFSVHHHCIFRIQSIRRNLNHIRCQ